MGTELRYESDQEQEAAWAVGGQVECQSATSIRVFGIISCRVVPTSSSSAVSAVNSKLHAQGFAACLHCQGRLRLCAERNVSQVIQSERSTEAHIVVGSLAVKVPYIFHGQPSHMHGRIELAVYCNKFARIV